MNLLSALTIRKIRLALSWLHAMNRKYPRRKLHPLEVILLKNEIKRRLEFCDYEPCLPDDPRLPPWKKWRVIHYNWNTPIRGYLKSF